MGRRLADVTVAHGDVLVDDPLLAGRECGIAEKTLWRWTQDPDFAKAYKAAQDAVLSRAINALRNSAVTFADTLRRICEAVDAPTSAKASAAARGLEILLKAASLEDLERRLSELERNAAIIEKRR